MEISLPSHIIPLPHPTPPLITQYLTPVLVELLLFIPKNVKKEQKSVYLLALWKRQVNLLLQSFPSVSSDLHQS